MISYSRIVNEESYTRFSMKLIARIIALLGFVAFALSASAATGLAPNTYRSSTVTGTVTWQDSATGESKALVADQLLPIGAIINTAEASSAALIFSSGATALIGEKSQVIVSKFQQELFGSDLVKSSGAEPSVSDTELLLNKGTVTSRVAKLKPKSNYSVRTPIGAAGVRGTTYQVLYDSVNKTLRVATAEGKVVFRTPDNVELPVDGGKDIVLTFETNDAGEITVTSTVAGNIPPAEMQVINGLVEAVLRQEAALPVIFPNQPILSDDTP